MKRLTVLFMILILLGGCSIGMSDEKLLPKDMNEEDLPEERAFQDEYTRRFLLSTEEVHSGYYPLRSRNGRYEMSFPKNGVIPIELYTSLDYKERIQFSSIEDEHVAVLYNILYLNWEPGSEDTGLSMLTGNDTEEFDYEKKEKEDQTIYISPLLEDTIEKNGAKTYEYFAYIQNKDFEGSLSLSTTVYCEEDCEDDLDKILKGVQKWIESFSFIDVKAEEGA